MRKETLVMLLVFLATLAAGLVAPKGAHATIDTVQICNQNFNRNTPVPIQKGRGNIATVKGNLVDMHSSIDAPAGIDVDVTDRRSAQVTLRITPADSVTPGNYTISLRYPVEVAGPDTFRIRVHDMPKITDMTVGTNPDDSGSSAGNVMTGQPYIFFLYGEGLANVRFKSAPFIMVNGARAITVEEILSATNIQLKIRVRFPQPIDRWFTSADFFDSGVNLNSEACRVVGGNGKIRIRAVAPVTDLIPADRILGVYTLGGGENCAGEFLPVVHDNYCNGVPAPNAANPRSEKIVQVEGITWGVKNNGNINITTPFKVRLKNGINVLQEKTINSILAGQTLTFTYNRPENHRKLMRNFNCPRCYDLNTAPYNWTDPTYTVEVDFENAVNEGSRENNNSRTY